jgi:hypothetical protein
MNIRRMTASAALVALVLGTTAMPALAERGGKGSDKGRGPKVSEQFGDMGDFGWGLDDVIKMNVKGIFKGRGEGIFAPGAKITHQEAAVAVVRLMDKEDAAKALTATEVDTLLAGIGDQKNIAAWARPSVAMLVKVGALDKDSPFRPLDDATRLDVAVLLVNAMGLKAEAQAKMSTELHFKDAKLIPANLVGYVAVAVDHQLITGYEDQTFRPQQAVKRIEMAVMMGRADRLVDREKQDEVKGTVKSVDSANNSFVVTAGDKDVSLIMANNASIFIDKAEKDLVDLKAGMKVEVKLNSDGKVVYVEAKTEAATPAPAITGAITALTASTPTNLALVSIANVAYPLSPSAAITLNGQAATFADLRVGDTVKATANLGLVVKLEVQRAATTVSGTVAAVTAATQTALAKVSLSVTTNGTTTTADYPVAANVVVKLNGQAVQLADLRASDTATLTISANLVTMIEAQRPVTTVTGSVAAVAAATQTALAKVSLSVSANGATTTTDYPVVANAVVKVNGQAAQLADLRVTDVATLSISAGVVIKIEVQRTASTVSGTVGAVVAATSAAPATITLSVTVNNSATAAVYTLAPTVTYKLNGQAAQFSDVHIGDTATLTLGSGLVDKVELTRAVPQTTVINGSLVSVAPVTAGQTVPAGTIGTIGISYMNNGAFTMVTYSVTSSTQLLVSGQAAQFSNLHPGDVVRATLLGDALVKLEVNP